MARSISRLSRLRAIYLAAPALLFASAAPSTAGDEGPLPAATAMRSARIVAPGLVEPISEEIEIAADVIGRLKSVPVDEGDAIAKGQILAEIENADLKASLAVAEANRDMRQAGLDKLHNGAREEERAQAAANLAEAAAREAEARRDLARKAPLAASGVESRKVLDEAAATAAAAEARRMALSAQHTLIDGAPRPEDVRIAEAQLAEAQAKVAEIQAQIAKTIIKSPIDGVVLSRQKKTGEAVANLPPTPILHIGDISRLRVRADVDEADVARVAVGQKVWVRADAYGGQHFGGTIVRVGVSLGRKNFRTERSTERLDTKVLETLIDLDPNVRLPVGLRVDVWDDGPRGSTPAKTEPAPSIANETPPQPPPAPVVAQSAAALQPAEASPPGPIAPPVVPAHAATPEEPVVASLEPSSTFAGRGPVSPPAREPVAEAALATVSDPLRANSAPQAAVLEPSAEPAAATLEPESTFAGVSPATARPQASDDHAAEGPALPTAVSTQTAIESASSLVVATLRPEDTLGRIVATRAATHASDAVRVMPATAPTPAPTSDMAAGTTPATYGAPIDKSRIVLLATDETWVQVRDATGRAIFTRALKSGERYGVPNQPGLSLVAGNAAGLEISIDGASMPPLGKPNRVARDVDLDPDRLLERLVASR